MPHHDRVVRVLRWIAVLPGALVGAALLHFLLVVLYTALFAAAGDDGFARRLVLRTIVNVVFGAAVVGLAGAIAPARKQTAAWGVALLFTAASAAIWAVGLDVGAAWDRYATVVSVAAALLAAASLQTALMRPIVRRREADSPLAAGAARRA